MLNNLRQLFVTFLCQRSFDKTSNWQTEKSSQTELEQPQQDDRGVFCASCQIHLAHQRAAIEFGGAHRHCFTNPMAIEFEIALYRTVVCERYGPLTEDYSWFAGYAWQIVLCSSCHIHLGWRYHHLHSPDFYGLITDRIVEK